MSSQSAAHSRTAPGAVRTGADVAVGEAFAFVPGGKAIRFASISDERVMHPALRLQYRVAEDYSGAGYVLFDTQTVWPAS